MQFYTASEKQMKERKIEKDLKLALALLSHDESELMYFSPPPPSTWIWKWAKVHLPPGEQK